MTVGQLKDKYGILSESGRSNHKHSSSGVSPAHAGERLRRLSERARRRALEMQRRCLRIRAPKNFLKVDLDEAARIRAGAPAMTATRPRWRR